MGVPIKAQYNKFKFYMFVYWALMLSVSGMYTMYIIRTGFSKAEVSIAVTLFTISSLLGQLVMGYLADHFKCLKIITSVSIGIGAVAAAAFIFLKQNWYIITLNFIWGFFLSGTIPLSEVWCIETLNYNGDQWQFGKIRGFGSVGYGLSGVVLGLLLQNTGWGILGTYVLVLAVIVIVATLLLEESKKIAFYKHETKENRGKVSIKDAFRQIVKIKPLRSFIIILFMYNFVVKGIYNYLSILVSDFGGGPLSLGFTYFFDAAPEVVTFFLATKLISRYRSKELIFMSFILQILRLSLILIFKSPIVIIMMGILSGFAYGLFATAYKTYIYELAPENYKISCLSLSESIIGFAGVVSAPVFGFVIMKFSGFVSIALGLLIDIAAAFILAMGLYKKKK